MSEGFLGRWSKRKLDVKEGKAVEAEPLPEPQEKPAPPASTVVAVQDPPPAPIEEPPPLTLEDVKALTPESDFTRFAASDVAPDVKNAAMKKLFADPRYNVMDGMDVYIDDYSKPDPIPYAMLRKLASANSWACSTRRKRRRPKQRKRRNRQGMLRITPARKAWHSRKRFPQQYPRRPYMPTLICDCNKTMPLQEKSLGAALGEELQLHSSLCRREAGDFQRAIKGGAEVVVACTQEKRLFGEIGEQTEGRVSPVKFVNIRETGGWSRDASQAMPKLAALLAAAHLPDPSRCPSSRTRVPAACW
jgi:hypothetical protein